MPLLGQYAGLRGEGPRGFPEAAEASPHPVSSRRLKRQSRVVALKEPRENHFPVAVSLRHLHRRWPC